jgi:uncharacterized lipoprotein YmbA
MNKRIIQIVLMALFIAGCAKVPVKQFYVLNYLPINPAERLNQNPYPYTIRLKEFDIEEAYSRPQIVYRQSPFQLRYYVYRVWAVKPTKMITDLLYKHLTSIQLVSNVIRRFDDGPKPEYELSGMIEALEEYDSEELWFAHLALRIQLTRLSDGKMIYSKRFDHRKRVFQHEPEYVIREMSSLMEYTFSQVMREIDIKFAEDSGISTTEKSEQQTDIPLPLNDSTQTQEGR